MDEFDGMMLYTCECSKPDCDLVFEDDGDWEWVRVGLSYLDLDRPSIFHPDCQHIPEGATPVECDGRLLAWVK